MELATMEKGIALKCNEFTTLAYKLDALLDAPARMQSMREKALLYGRPHAAETIVDTLLNQPEEEADTGQDRGERRRRQPVAGDAGDRQGLSGY